MKSLKTLSPIPVVLCIVALGATLACDTGNPIAPAGTILTITASPSRIGLTGTATITVTGRRPDGNPLADGTEIRFSVSLGSIDGIVETDNNGVARATLQADGRPGTATVTAATITGESEATIDVAIGETPESKPTVTVVITPDNVTAGESAQITVIARNNDGSPASEGLAVLLTTTLGSIKPSQTTTDSNGQAQATIFSGDRAGTATVTAFVGSADPATETLTIRVAADVITLQAVPETVPVGGTPTNDPIELSAFVFDAQAQPINQQLVIFTSRIGTLSAKQDLTNNTGEASVTLEVLDTDLDELDPGVSQFTVTAETPAPGGNLTAQVVIRVTGGN